MGLPNVWAPEYCSVSQVLCSWITSDSPHFNSGPYLRVSKAQSAWQCSRDLGRRGWMGARTMLYCLMGYQIILLGWSNNYICFRKNRRIQMVTRIREFPFPSCWLLHCTKLWLLPISSLNRAAADSLRVRFFTQSHEHRHWLYFYKSNSQIQMSLLPILHSEKNMAKEPKKKHLQNSYYRSYFKPLDSLICLEGRHWTKVKFQC